MVFLPIQEIDRIQDRLLQVVNGFEVVVVDGGTLQVTLEAFDQVQVWAIRCVPDDRQAVAMGLHVFSHGLGAMNRAIVQEQIDMIPTVWRLRETTSAICGAFRPWDDRWTAWARR